MKALVHQQNLKKALALVERVTSKNASLPILSNILLKTESGRLRISATNLEIGVTCFLGAKIEEVGEIAVPGKIFSDLVSHLQDEMLTLTVKNETLLVQAPSHKSTILGHTAKEYPIIPKVKSGTLCVLPAQTIKSSFASLFDSIAVSEARAELSGLYMNCHEKGITFAATDSFRLTEKKIPAKIANPQTIIIPRNTVAECIRLSGDIQGDIEIRVADNQFSLTHEDVELVSRLVDIRYPDYTRVIPEHFVSKVLVDKAELDKKCRLAGLFSSSISDITLQSEADSLLLTAKNSDRGDTQASVAAILKNEPFQVTLNFNYLLDGLKAIPTDKVVIEFTGSGSPLVLRPNNDVKDFVYLIMPLRNQ